MRSWRMAVLVPVLAGSITLAGCGSGGSGGQATGSGSGSSTAHVAGEPAVAAAICARLNANIATATDATDTLSSNGTDKQALRRLQAATDALKTEWETLERDATDAAVRSAAASAVRYVDAQIAAVGQISSGSGLAEGSFLDAEQQMLKSLGTVCGNG